MKTSPLSSHITLQKKLNHHQAYLTSSFLHTVFCLRFEKAHHMSYIHFKAQRRHQAWTLFHPYQSKESQGPKTGDQKFSPFMTHLWQDVQDLLVKNFAQKLHPALPPQQKKGGENTPVEQQISSGFADSPKLFWGFQHSHPRPATPPVFLEEPGFFHKKETDPAGLEVSINCPKSEQKHRKKKTDPTKRKNPFQLGDVSIGKIQFGDFLTESSRLHKSWTCEK